MTPDRFVFERFRVRIRVRVRISNRVRPGVTVRVLVQDSLLRFRKGYGSGWGGGIKARVSKWSGLGSELGREHERLLQEDRRDEGK